jgi:heterodisulfide reductase subunit B
MKITRRQLRRIIRESLNEQSETPDWWRHVSSTGFYKSYDDLVARGKFNVEKDIIDARAAKQFKSYILRIYQDITDKNDPIPKLDPIVQKFSSAKPEIKGMAYEIGGDAHYSGDKEKQRAAMKAILALLKVK